MAVIGINTFLWTTDWDRNARQILSKIQEIGFDAVQIPILSLETFRAEEVSEVLRELGLQCYISAGLRNETDITSDDPNVRRKGIDFLTRCVDLACRMEAPFLSGSFHSVFGKKSDRPVDIRQWTHSAESLKQVAREAQKCDLSLVLEPINRYESFLVNTAGQARKLIGMIGEPNVKIQLDTFHMNLEEGDFYNTIKSVGDDLVHFHVAENHRGQFGGGMMRWDDVFTALSEIHYQGAIVIESFVPDVPAVATAACIWRQLAPSADALARDGLEFIRTLADKYKL